MNTTSCPLFLTGKAGTGKSTLLRYITETIKKNFVVLAPTGIAAVNVGGQTIHSFFRLPFKPLMPDDPDYSTPRRLQRSLMYTKNRLKMLKELDLIIIDEISMVRADIIDFISKILCFATGNHRQPFGGKQMLFVGDVFQLEPVVTPDIREIMSHKYKSPYFFDAQVFENVELVAVELTKVYRQTDRNFVELLDRVRTGSPTAVDLINLNGRLDRTDNASDGRFVMTIATRRDMVDHINENHLASLPAEEVTFEGKVSGDFPEAFYPTDLRLTLKEGAQIVFVKNDSYPVKRWVNGTIGRVVGLNDDKLEIRLENGSKYTVEREVWSNTVYHYDEETRRVEQEVIGTFTQYPVKLAWALTIHKSQGLTFNNVNIDVGHGAFTGGQSYVALSRCTSLEGIRLKSTINERDIFVNPAVVNFSHKFNNHTTVENAIRSAQADSLYASAKECFERGDYGEAMKMLCCASSFRNDLSNPAVARLLSHMVSRIDNHNRAENASLAGENLMLRTQLRMLADEYVEKGDDCRAKGWDMNEAVQLYDKALGIYSDHIDAMIGKAHALLAMSDADMAIALLDKATATEKSDYRAPFELGRFFLSCGDYTNALDRMLVALDRNDKVPAVHDELAAIYEATDDPRSAKRHKRLAATLRKKL